MPRAAVWGLIVLLTALLGALAAAGYKYRQYELFLKRPAETPGREVTAPIEPGMSFDQTAAMLVSQGVVTDARLFRVLGRKEGHLGRIRAGDFLVNTGWTPGRVLQELVYGRPLLIRLALPEGLAWWQTARIVAQAGFADFEQMRAAMRDKALLARRHIPFDDAEGFLFPETYLLQRPRKKDALAVVDMLTRQFWEKAAQIWPDGPPDAEEIRRVVILASLVEKETAVPDERARVAGVYANRLERRMPLQCDPTVIYGLGDAFDGNLTRANLEDEANPYNTYRHPGLPPGPICSPGLASLKAAAAPEKHDYLYFVARRDGSHEFSRNLDDHNRAVRRYQRSRS